LSLRECDCCGTGFIKGTGHLCLCSHCDKKHPLCNECYKAGMKAGNIKPNNYKVNQIDNTLLKKLK